MKTMPKLLYVEADEEITDLVDRLRDLNVEDEVTFVVPDRARSLQSAMSFRLLKRYADSYGKRVNVVSSDPRLQAMSEETGFTAYPSLAAYDQSASLAGSEVGAAPDVPAFSPIPPTEAMPRAPQYEPISRPPQAEPVSRAPQAPSPYAPAPATPRSPWAQPTPPGPMSPPPLPPTTPVAARTYAPQPAFSPAVPTRQADIMSAPPRKPATPTPTSARVPPSLRSYRPYMIGAGVLAVIVLLLGVLYLPSATATITVQGTPVKADITLQGAPGVAAGATDQFPTQAIHGEESQTLPGTATGQKQVSAVAATGTVRFTDSCVGVCGSIPVGAGTSVSDGQQHYFLTQSSVTVSASKRTADVAVKATQAGAPSNLAAGQITVIDVPHDPDLTVSNATATTGGADQRTATVIQQSDIDNVTTGYLKDATTRVTDTINGKGGGLKIVMVGSGITSTVTTDHKVGDEVTSFSIMVKVVGDAVAYDDKAVVALLLGDLQHKIPQGTQLAGTPTQSFSTSGATADGHITATGHVSGFYTPVFLVSAIRSHLKAMSRANAEAFLQSLPNVLNARVVQSPFGLPWLPLFSSRITVNIQEVSGTATP